MTERISMQQEAEAFEPVELDVWGTIFETVDTTQPVLDAIDKLQEEAAALQAEGKTTEAITVIGKLYDACLRVKPGQKGKGNVNAETLILRKFKSGDVGLDTLRRTFQKVLSEGRPT